MAVSAQERSSHLPFAEASELSLIQVLFCIYKLPWQSILFYAVVVHMFRITYYSVLQELEQSGNWKKSGLL